MLKILNNGRTVEGLPPASVLRSPDTPADLAPALSAHRDALVALAEAKRTHDAAAKVARDASIRPGREDREAEVRAATVEEARSLKEAERACMAAARALVAVVEENAEPLRVLAARLSLAAHAEAVDLALDLAEARSRMVGPRVPLHPMVDPVVEARSRAGEIRRSVSEDLDKVNTHALAEIAGTRFGLVEVVSTRAGDRILTTARRARSLVGGGSSGWAFVDEEARA